MEDSRHLNYFFMIVAGMMIFSNFFVTIEGNLKVIELRNAACKYFLFVQVMNSRFGKSEVFLDSNLIVFKYVSKI